MVTWIPFKVRVRKEGLARELRLDLIEILPLHARAVAEEFDRLAAFRLCQFRGIDLVHDEPGHLQAESIEHLEGAFRIEDRHALRNQDHEE